MKLKSENTASSGMAFIYFLMIIKTLFTQPISSRFPFLGYKGVYDIQEILSAVGALILSVLFATFLVKIAKCIGERAILLMLIAVAEPLFVTTVSSLFHALAAAVAIIWVAVCLWSKNKSLSAAVSVACAAVISFIMPNAIFSYVLLGIIVVLISMWNDSKIIGIISAAASAVVAVLLTAFIDIEVRMNMKVSGIFYNLGGKECNPLTFLNLTYDQRLADILSRLGDAIVASLPVIAAVIFVAVAVFEYKPDYVDNKKTPLALKNEKILMVIAITVPYVFAAFASMVCTGVSGIMGFNIVPIVIIFTLILKGNKAVIYALDKLRTFAKAHPVLSVIALVWLAANTTAFSIVTKFFDCTTQFVM